MRISALAVVVLATSCAASTVTPQASATNVVAVPTDLPTPSAAVSASSVASPSATPIATPARSPSPTSTRTPVLTPSPDARAITAAFTFAEGGRWIVGYVDDRRVLHLGSEARTVSTPVLEMTFVDSLHGWALGRVAEMGPVPNCQHAGSTCHDVIARTVDGGRTWTTVRSVYTTGVTGDTFHGLQFVDALHGWTAQYIDGCATSCAGELLATDDGGATWAVRSRANGVFSAFRFADATRGWAVETDWWSSVDGSSAPTRLLATSDGGRTWTPQLEGKPIYDLSVLDRTRAWAIARQINCGSTCPLQPAQLYRTTDGARWSLVAQDLSALPCVGKEIFAPTFIDADRGLIASGGPALDDAGGAIVTRDGGATWSCATAQPDPMNARRRALLYGGMLLVVTRARDGSDRIVETPDLGAHWTVRATN